MSPNGVKPASTRPQRSALAVHRFAANLSQEELGRRARLSRESIANLESGKYQPRRLTAESIARALGVPVEDLFPTNDARPAGGPTSVNDPAGRGPIRDER